MPKPWEKHAQPQGTGGGFLPPSPYQQEQDAADRAAEAERQRLARESAAREEERLRILRERADREGQYTPGQKALDEEYVKSHIKWVSGGYTDLNTKLKALEGALRVLESGDTVSGPIYGRLPKFIQQQVNPQAVDIRHDVERTIQQTLRETLGAQFTAKEGENLLARTFDPTQPEQYNADNARALIEQMRNLGMVKQSQAEYFNERGTINGWTRPPLEELTDRYGEKIETTAPQAAAAGATQGSRPIPPEMQAEHAAYLSENWGKLTPEGYTAFRERLDEKYDFPSNSAAYASFVPIANQVAEKGGTPEMIGAIPAVNYELSPQEQFEHNVVSSPVGAAVAGAANAGGFGIPSLMAPEQMTALREARPVSTTLGEVGGGIAGTMVGGGILGQAAHLAPAGGRTASILANPITADVGYGAIYGATQAEDPLYGAVGGGLTAAGGSFLGGQIGKRLPGLFGIRRLVNEELSPAERTVSDILAREDAGAITGSLREGAELGLPMMPTDVSMGLESLAGAAIRRSPQVAAQARQTLGRRTRGQVDRMTGAIERDLGPIENIPQRSEDLIAQARTQAGPLYDEAYAAPGAGAVFPKIEPLLNRPSMQSALARARTIAAEEGRDPTALGFKLNEQGETVLTQVPSWQTLDYAKRGIDDVLERFRDPTSGRLRLDEHGRAIDNTRRQFLETVDEANPAYAQARAAYAGPAAEREAMRMGQKAVTMSPDQLSVNVRNASPTQVEQMRLGFQSGLANKAEGLRTTTNPFQSVFDNTAMESRLGTMYGDTGDVARLLRQRDLERDMAASSNRLVGNSMTAERHAADEAFGLESGLSDAVPMVLETSATGVPIFSGAKALAGRIGARAIRDRMKLGALRNAEQRADELAPYLLESDPARAADMMDDIIRRDVAHRAVVDALIRDAQARGGHIGAGSSTAAVIAGLMRE